MEELIRILFIAALVIGYLVSFIRKLKGKIDDSGEVTDHDLLRELRKERQRQKRSTQTLAGSPDLEEGFKAGSGKSDLSKSLIESRGESELERSARFSQEEGRSDEQAESALQKDLVDDNRLIRPVDQQGESDGGALGALFSGYSHQEMLVIFPAIMDGYHGGAYRYPGEKRD